MPATFITQSAHLHWELYREDVFVTSRADHGPDLAEPALSGQDVVVGETEGPELPHRLIERGPRMFRKGRM